MMPLYIFCACLGIPLLALFAFGGGEGDAELGDAGFELDGDLGAGMDLDVGADADFGGANSGGIGDATALFRRIPVSSYAFFLSFFGGVGVVSTWANVAFVTTLVMAVTLGLLAAFLNTAAFSFLRNTDSDSTLTDREIEGRMATVSVPIDAGKRGRVWFDTGEERVQLTAGSLEGELDQTFELGEKVVIVSIDNGVAQVMSVDPELND